MQEEVTKRVSKGARAHSKRPRHHQSPSLFPSEAKNATKSTKLQKKTTKVGRGEYRVKTLKISESERNQRGGRLLPL
jgi:hypothetical protein